MKWSEYYNDLEKKFEKMKEKEPDVSFSNDYVILKHVCMLGCHVDKVLENQEKIMATQKEQGEAIASLLGKKTPERDSNGKFLPKENK